MLKYQPTAITSTTISLFTTNIRVLKTIAFLSLGARNALRFRKNKKVQICTILQVRCEYEERRQFHAFAFPRPAGRPLKITFLRYTQGDKWALPRRLVVPAFI